MTTLNETAPSPPGDCFWLLGCHRPHRLFLFLLFFFSFDYLAFCVVVQVDSDLKPLPVNVRVGQAVETVGQAGKPKTITGFQTHTTPVLLGVRDRAEVRQSMENSMRVSVSEQR